MEGWFVGPDTQAVIRACTQFPSSLEEFADALTPISRPKPYERPSKPPGFTTPNDRGSSRIPHDHTPRTNIDGSTLGRLFQNLAPLVKESSSDFDSKAAAICASLGLDPTTSEEIIGSFKRQFRANGSQESRYVG